MRALVFVLLLANLLAGAWLWLEGPVNVVREPARLDLQLDADRAHPLSEAALARKRQAAQAAAAAAAASTPASTAAATAPPASAAGASPAAAVSASPAGTAVAPASTELPLASCIDVDGFPSEAAARKLRARLATAGLAEHASIATSDKVSRLRVTDVDAAAEAQIHLILRDFPKQEMSHCSEAPAGK